MPTFKLDDREIPFEKGETIIAAAYRQGVEIPHYCWHPGLSVAANCRMCLVEIEPAAGQRAMMLDILKWDAEKNDYVVDRKPKLQPACQIAASDGMVVRSESSANVKQARAHVQEFLLVNHPVDCPICDQAGECKLQDYWMTQQRTFKRMRDEPVHKPKAQPFGEKIVYDAERCITCTRCIRFCDEVAGDHMLDLRERGNKNEVVLAPGRALEGDYTLMTEHVCPVGALTSSHFRFRARVWTLKEVPSICTGCATGCNTWLDYDPREQKVYRLRPRDNEKVNKFWMCDDGMMSYQHVHENRVKGARTGRGSSEALGVDEAVSRAAELFKKAGKGKVAVVLSAQMSTEDNLVAVELGRQFGASFYLSAKAPWRADKILRNADQNPNRAGATAAAMGAAVGSLRDLMATAGEGKLAAALVLGSDSDVSDAELSAMGRIADVVVLAANEGPLTRSATLVIPVASVAEADGSFVNAKGLAQGFKRGLQLQPEGAPGWQRVAEIGRAMGLDLAYKKFKEVRAALTVKVPTASPDAPAASAAGAGTESHA
ncbi:MAG: (2Fe-2S)-binding protein [Myxococcales bacterium]|nr:(2Fe-2S)-binding protein [Myxococcales bacterium]